MGASRRRSGRRGARGTLTRPRDGVATASSQQRHSESSRQEEPPSGGSTRLGERKEKREASAGERGAELASAADAYAPAALHDCGAAADLPRGRPRKPAGVSSAARARRTSKSRLSVPSRAGATSERTRPARKTQGRCRGAGA